MANIWFYPFAMGELSKHCLDEFIARLQLILFGVLLLKAALKIYEVYNRYKAY